MGTLPHISCALRRRAIHTARGHCGLIKPTTYKGPALIVNATITTQLTQPSIVVLIPRAWLNTISGFPRVTERSGSPRLETLLRPTAISEWLPQRPICAPSASHQPACLMVIYTKHFFLQVQGTRLFVLVLWSYGSICRDRPLVTDQLDGTAGTVSSCATCMLCFYDWWPGE